jgi:CheY-like chemotaxis protein
MSHELRTPLNAILGFSQLLEMEEHNERQAESIDHISRAGRNLLTLINEVLDIARLDSGRIKIEHDPVEIAPLLEELVSYTQTLAAPQRISIRFTEPLVKNPVVIGDRERLKQVFVNLLSNAVKYNRPEGLVTITIAPSGVDYWKISITDTGPGIPAESLSRLFVPFERLGQKEGGTEGGTGLGLTLCQRLVKALEGRIGVASTVGVGSTFWVELPALVSINVPAEPEVSIAAPPPIAEDKVRTLLYVEDDLANLSLLERIIETRKNLKCVACVRGGLALDLARKHRPTLILLDLNLPDMTGEALFALLKADPEMQHIPVIIVTGEINSDRSENLLRDGAVDILSKPYRIQDLFAMIDAHTKA